MPNMLGTRVLDLSESITGAYAGRLLASMGAEVVLGEPPVGSPLRGVGPLVETPSGLVSPTWEYVSALKDSLILVGVEAVVAAAGQFDLVLLATDGPAAPISELAERLRSAHPTLSVVAVSPFGLTGPYSQWRAGGLELWAIGGHLALTGEPDRPPLPGGGPWDSYLVGAYAALAAQAALLAEERGVLIDVAAMQALADSHQWSITLYTHNGYVKRRTGNRLGEMHHPICLYPCSDGWVCIAAASFHQWEGLCIAMEQVELLADDTLANAAVRFDRADELDELIVAWTEELTVAEVVEACQGNFCPAGPVSELTELLHSEQLQARQYWAAVPHLGARAVMPSRPFRLPSSPTFRPAPALGSVGTGPSAANGGGSTMTRSADTDRSGPVATGSAFAPLAGVRVLELTISWAGPMAARFLADLGADVVKIEHPTSRGVAVIAPDPDAEPDPWSWGESVPVSVRNGLYPDAQPGAEWWNRMGHFNKMNRSKRSLCLDIKADGGRDVFERLVRSADIVINNYSPRGVRSLGIDHETLRAIKPDLVTVAMSGFGATGPGSEAVSWGPILDAASGLAATTGYADSGPYKQGIAYPDPVGGTHGAAAVLGAWWEHQRTGEPVHVDLSQLETLLSVAGDQVLETSMRGTAPVRRGARSAVSAPAGVYPCTTEDDVDRWLALTIYDDTDWQRLAAVVAGLDDPAWADVAGRQADHDRIDERIAAWTAGRSPAEAMATLQHAGVAAAMATTNRDLVEDPHLRARGFMIELTHSTYGPTEFPGSPFLVDGRPLAIRPLSAMGADNREVLTEVGLTPTQIDELYQHRAIATAPPS